MTVTIILIEPENPGNTGAILRAMKNFDFSNLVLVHPQFGIDSDELKHRAKWARDLIKKIKVIDTCNSKTFRTLKKNFDYLIATTAKTGRDYNIPRSPINPQQLAETLSTIRKKSKIGILIGREGIGLTNEEIAFADFTVTIPASKKYGTLNISHATTIILYELFKKSNTENTTSHITPISEREKKQIMIMVNDVLDRMHFATTEKKETQQILWKKIVGRSFLSKREAYALMGFLRKIK